MTRDDRTDEIGEAVSGKDQDRKTGPCELCGRPARR